MYIVDNTLLKAKTIGLAYRLSKKVQDVDIKATAAWGSTVSGVTDGNGWLMVAQQNGERYLPFFYNGVMVLTSKGPAAAANGSSMQRPEAVGDDAIVSSMPAMDSADSACEPAVFSPNAAAGTGGKLVRTYSGQRFYSPKSPAVAQLQRAASFGGLQAGEERACMPTGSPRATPQSGLKRSLSGPAESGEPVAKRGTGPDPPSPGTGGSEARAYDLQSVVVSFSDVGAYFASTVLGKSLEKGDKVFDWEGVRRCVRHLRCEMGLQVTGVVFENWWGPDRGGGQCGIPNDIRMMCASILETPRLTGGKHKVADKEMTMKCAWRRNCRFVDNDDCGWRQEMRDEKCRAWLETSQDVLQMQYFFEGKLGRFKILDS